MNCKNEIYIYIWYVSPSLVTPRPVLVIPYICCSNSATCKFPLVSLHVRISRGESKTELVVYWSQFNSARNSYEGEEQSVEQRQLSLQQRHNGLITDSAQEREASWATQMSMPQHLF